MEKIKYFTSFLTFYLKGEVAFEQNFVKFKKPNTILGLIPLGAKKESVPVTQLSVVESNFKLHFGKFLIGLLVSILGLFLLTGDSGQIIGIIIAILGLNSAMSAFETVVTIRTTAGTEKKIEFFIIDKGKANKVEEFLNKIINDRLNDTNTREQTDRIVDAINNK